MNRYNGEPLYIYGTGPMAKGCYKDLCAKGIPVVGFIDHLDRQVEGARVYKPDELLLTGNDVVVLAVLNYQADIRAITARLAGFRRIVSVVEFYEFFDIQFSGMHFWLTDPWNYANWWTEIIQANKLWKDEKSQDLYDDIIAYRRTGSLEHLPPGNLCYPEGDCYHPADVPRWQNPLRFIDCGAYTGDTQKDLQEAGYSIEECVAFEPDPEPFGKLAGERMCVAIPCGVYSETKQLRFEARGDMSSEIIADGSSVVQCVSIDDALPNFAPNLIKMDIEGAEMEALKGAEGTIRNHHPGLAISVYHRPEDMWKIPLWVNEIGGYDFYLRVHSNSTFDTVMYAVPR